MRMIWIFPLLILFSSCCFLPPCLYNAAKADANKQIVMTQTVDPLPFSEVIIPYAVELKYAKRLRFEDSAVYYDDFVERFRVIFSSQEILELCEARDLMVTVVEELLSRLNSKPSVTVSFDHFPITYEDLEIYFSFESFDIEYNDGSYIAWMSLHDGLVRYWSGLLKNPRIDYWDARIEPYYKSLQFVELTRAGEEHVKNKFNYGKPIGSHEIEL